MLGRGEWACNIPVILPPSSDAISSVLWSGGRTSSQITQSDQTNTTISHVRPFLKERVWFGFSTLHLV